MVSIYLQPQLGEPNMVQWREDLHKTLRLGLLLCTATSGLDDLPMHLRFLIHANSDGLALFLGPF
jgi:hypothetical protein